MKRICLLVAAMLPIIAMAQSYPHYTMFMFNKLIYNPAYAGNKNMTTVNGIYRSQWTGIDGAPRNYSVTIDGPVGNYMKPFRHVALGLGVNNEKIGVTDNTNVNAYYSYRIQTGKTVLSFGLQAGASVYNARYSDLNPLDMNDKVLATNVDDRLLPNAGVGVYWTGDNFYVSAAVPNLLENYYDKNSKTLVNDGGKQIRSYFLSGGYVFNLSDNFKLEPQALLRYAGNSAYNLPLNCDINLSAIFYDRLMIGATYRTDKSVEGIINIQATKNISVGYAYDWTVSELQTYAKGSHEITVGFDFVRDVNKYVNPRFIKSF
ncbi:MAG: type IX secretion system membrane protein PorP/SprF [Sphingobacteriales bacterium]|nr:MAG: type IX secretion system membrane protein PorP/SprF [Sphingobacteriales bacterium]